MFRETQSHPIALKGPSAEVLAIAPSDPCAPPGAQKNQKEDTMSAQTRLRLAKSARTTMKDAKLIGPADPDEKMEVTIYLRRGSAGVYPNIAQQASSPVKERRHFSRE